MASFIAQRIGRSLNLSLQLATRSRTISLSLNSSRPHHSSRASPRSSHRSSSHRHFSSHVPRSQTASSTSKPASSTSAQTSKPAPKPTASAAAATSAPRDPQPQTERHAENSTKDSVREISSSSGLSDMPPAASIADDQKVDWARSFHGLGSQPFSGEAAKVLMEPLNEDDIEIKADGIVYLPEIKYRRVLNRAFGPGGWGMAPRGETIVTPKLVTREYALLAHGRLVAVARGEQDYFDSEGIPTATEGCKSNALMRCCKDLGIASELWDPRFIRNFMANKAKEIWVEHQVTKKKRKITIRKDDIVRYPFKEVSMSGASGKF